MKYTFTGNQTYRRGVGIVPRTWVDGGKTVQHKDVLREHFCRNMRMYDADSAGSEVVDIVFDDGKAFRLEHSWWLDYNVPEDQGYYDYEYTIEEISIDDANVPNKTPGRDWL